MLTPKAFGVDRIARSVTLRRSGALSHLARNCACIWRIGRGSPSRAGQCRKTKRSIRRNRDRRRVHSETKEISNAENQATSHPHAEAKNSEQEIRCEKNVRQNEQKCDIDVGAKRGDTQATKNADATSRKSARCVRNHTAAATRDCGANASAFAAVQACGCRFSERTGSGCDRKIRHRGGPGIRAAAVATAAPIRFLAVESSNQLPLPNQFGHRSDPARTGETASLAVHCCAQQRHPAGQRARLRLLPSACSPNAERSRLSLRHWKRHIDR